jgi:hypothetical protein
VVYDEHQVVTADDYCNETSEHWTHTEEELHEIVEVNTTAHSGSDSEDTTLHLESTNASDDHSNVHSDTATLPQTNRNDSLEDGELFRYLWIGHCCTDDLSSTTSTVTATAAVSSAPPAPQLRRRVPNCCAICLAPYEVNETVVWSCCHGQTSHTNHSSNDNATNSTGCNHAFHYDCMIDWLIKVQDGTPCPCCRQEFTDLPMLPRRRKLNATQQQLQLDRLRNFDLGVFSFR